MDSDMDFGMDLYYFEFNIVLCERVLDFQHISNYFRSNFNCVGCCEVIKMSLKWNMDKDGKLWAYKKDIETFINSEIRDKSRIDLDEDWKEMVRLICRRIEDETIDIEGCKYDLEALVRPFFGDDDDKYDYLEMMINAAKEMRDGNEQ